MPDIRSPYGPDPSDEWRIAKAPDNSEAAAQFEDSSLDSAATPHSRWSRWYWPIVSLLAWIAFELTASPAITAVVLCCHFGAGDFLTGVWLWRTDPHRARGRACGWFSLVRGVTRSLGAAFVFALVLVWLSVLLNPPGPNPAQGAKELPAGFVGIAILSLVGIPLATLLGIIGCLSARRGGARVWLDPALHRARTTRTWPPQGFGYQNQADWPFLFMVSNLLLLSLLVATGLGILLADWIRTLIPAAAQPAIGPKLTIVLSGVLFLLQLAGLIRLTSGVRARNWAECWIPEPLFPAEGHLTRSVQLPGSRLPPE